MPNAAKMLLVILLLPFFAALGHDVYINYFSTDEKVRDAKNLLIDPNDFMTSDVGWIWQTYSPGSMQFAQDMMGEESWKENMDPFLKQTTLFVTIIPFIAGLAFLAITFIIGVWPFSRFGKKRKEAKTNYGVYGKAKTKEMKYTKK